MENVNLKAAREKAFLEDYNLLVRKHGLQLSAIIQPKSYGTMLQIEPGLAVVEVEGWDPENVAVESPVSNTTSNILND